jgi:hypothetical protein
VGIDPGLAIVLAVAVVVVVFALVGWRQRSAAKARLDAMRKADRIELEIVSSGRVALVQLAFLGPLVLGVPFVAMALGEWGRAHAVELVIAVILLAMAGILVPMALQPKWTRSGRIVLDDRELVLVNHGSTERIALDEAWRIREGLVLPGRHTEIVVALFQGRTRLTFRYPLFLLDAPPVERPPITAPAGALLGHEARAIHERLRSRRPAA